MIFDRLPHRFCGAFMVYSFERPSETSKWIPEVPVLRPNSAVPSIALLPLRILILLRCFRRSGSGVLFALVEQGIRKVCSQNVAPCSRKRLRHVTEPVHLD